jgi:hypothetical protein
LYFIQPEPFSPDCRGVANTDANAGQATRRLFYTDMDRSDTAGEIFEPNRSETDLLHHFRELFLIGEFRDRVRKILVRAS